MSRLPTLNDLPHGIFCQVYDNSSRVLGFLLIGIREMVTWELRFDARAQGPDLRMKKEVYVYT